MQPGRVTYKLRYDKSTDNQCFIFFPIIVNLRHFVSQNKYHKLLIPNKIDEWGERKVFAGVFPTKQQPLTFHQLFGAR